MLKILCENLHLWAWAQVLAGVGVGHRKKPQGGPCFSLAMIYYEVLWHLTFAMICYGIMNML